MKLLPLATTLLLCSLTAGAQTYTTTFPNPENPLSESGKWLDGGTVGQDWNDIKTTAGYAQSDQTSSSSGLDDGTAILAGTWGPDQTVQIVAKNPGTLGGTQEVEMRLRSTMTAHNSTGYEIDFATSSGSGNCCLYVVKWNGVLNDFTNITPGGAINFRYTNETNAILKASVIGNTITVYDCTSGTCNTLTSLQDSTFSGGAPGFGIDANSATVDFNFGITSFTATTSGGGGGGPPDPPTNLSNTVQQSSGTLLVGSNAVQSFVDSVGAGQAAAFKKTAVATGTASMLNIYVDSSDASSKFTIGIYNNNGNPHNLLASGVINSPVKGAWNSVSIPGTSITSGTAYWLTLLGNNGTPIWRDLSNCSVVQTSHQTNLTSLPSTWAVGNNYQFCNPSMYASQAGTSSTVALTWTASDSQGVSGYNIYRATTSGGPYSKINGTLDTATTYTDSTVANSTTYYYVVRAFNGTQESVNSNQTTAMVP